MNVTHQIAKYHQKGCHEEEPKTECQDGDGGREGEGFQTAISDLQKSRHLRKSRVTERHNRGITRKLKSHPPPQKTCEALFLRLVRLQFSLCVPIVPLRDATFLQMTRLLQVTGTRRALESSSEASSSACIESIDGMSSSGRL